ncbi:MAG TPA: uracil-DNA glycosylase family protein [Tepidisphaeraceae bacterium]|jgi:uracil-DNA glycosylase
MQSAADNSILITVDGRQVRTLRDILPDVPGLRILFIAKTPAPVSVEAGHYFQGTQGRMFWNRLKTYGLLTPTTKFEDDSLLKHGFGLTDIVKVPRGYGDEPSDAEYQAGLGRILDLIRMHRPKVVVFVYKRVLDQILRFGFGLSAKTNYGFNPALEHQFGARVFAFPLPGTPCTKTKAAAAMEELRMACSELPIS